METIFENKKIGIWGFGVVGKSALSFLSQYNCTISVLDKLELDEFQKALIKGHNATLVDASLLPQFLEMNDYIIASPGIDLKPFDLYQDKFLCELDIFARFIKKPTIAITGSVGKTTTTHVLTHLLNKLGKKALACGNIGFALFDALAIQDQYDILVLELSSFQLQHNTQFAPTIALVTNIYPNHLDYHADMEEYVTAKGQILAHQTEENFAIMSMSLMDCMWPFLASAKVNWLSPDWNTNITQQLSDITCHENWQLILATLETLNLSTENLIPLCADLPRLNDRIECVGTYKGVTFYNDSKATIPASTLTALDTFKGKKVILFLGGLSKGVDRGPFVKQLKGKVKSIICFGKEAEQLHQFCVTSKIISSSHATLEDAFDYCLKIIEPNDIVLFSPAGSSFDLFKNYHERGKVFTKLFATLVKSFPNIQVL
ncbi:MAG: UDP-N-acetylmuramoyl-L-alanine--D-glutamate ligase [Proteobacteria bacterium]|nr:UDP-N-acetylmuramoyl-L-alanine--D-glutamate ligase [Pseudomonadota bacterium]